MKITPEIKKKLEEFDFRYAEHIENRIYKIIPAKEAFPNASKPHYFTDEEMAFDDGEHDRACVIEFKDVLIF